MQSKELVDKGVKPQGKFFYGWFIVAGSFLTLFMGFGISSSFGVFFKPIQGEFGWDRATLALAVSINQLFHGILQPLTGRLVDRYGPRVIVAIGAPIMLTSLVLLSLISSRWHLYASYGFLGAVGLTSIGMVPATALVNRWFSKKRGTALGLTVTGFAAGQFVIVPFSAYLILLYGWRYAYVILGLILLSIILPIALLVMRNHPAELGCHPDGELLSTVERDSLPHPKGRVEAGRGPELGVSGAVRTAPFWLLVGSFFVCGFTTISIHTHFVPYATDRGFSPTMAANAVGLMGAMNIAALLSVGTISDWLGRKNILAGIYFFRGLALVMLVFGLSQITEVYAFAALFGFFTLATVPLTSGLTADKFGNLSFGVIYGLISFSHQIGGALGSYLGGVLYDLQGTYFWVFLIAAVLAFIASGLTFSIKERGSEDFQHR